MEDKKRDLIPVAAIAVFLVIIIILCVTRLTAKKNAEGQNGMPVTQAVETLESTGEETDTQETTDTARRETQSGGTQDGETKAAETVPGQTAKGQEETKSTDSIENEIPSGRKKTDVANKTDTANRTIGGNDPFAAAAGVNKTNEEMLMEMAGYWEQGNQKAVDDLAKLAWFMKMSDSIKDEETFYYYGERNAAGAPEGTGIACYADNAYYYGEWVNGKREGSGRWIKYYVYYDDDVTSDRAYTMHMYMGDWANDMPNGEGQEHYDLDMGQAAKKDRYLQNVIGTFRDGLYSGEMYMTTLGWNGEQEEWNGLAEEGIWSPYGAATNKKEIPVCQNVADDNNYLWIMVKNNKERGIEELMP